MKNLKSLTLSVILLSTLMGGEAVSQEKEIMPEIDTMSYSEATGMWYSRVGGITYFGDPDTDSNEINNLVPFYQTCNHDAYENAWSDLVGVYFADKQPYGIITLDEQVLTLYNTDKTVKEKIKLEEGMHKGSLAIKNTPSCQIV